MRCANSVATVLRVLNGRDVRSVKPCMPSRSKRLRHLLAVRRHQPHDRDALDQQLAPFKGESGILMAVLSAELL
jgi:hypothetical protein